jgi:hypothetical protein
MVDPDVVQLCLHCARGVPKMDLVGHADPYIAVHYPPSTTKPYFKTSTQKSTADPVWEDDVRIFIYSSADCNVLLKLFDEDFAKDELIGSVLIDLREEAKHAVIRVPGAKECSIEYSIERQALIAKSANQRESNKPQTDPMRTRMLEFFEQHCPDRIPQIDGLLAMGSDFNERQYCMALYDELGVPVNQRRFAPDFEARLTKFYQKYSPEKVEGVTAACDNLWKKSSEQSAWSDLFAKYLVSPTDRTAYLPAESTPPAPSAPLPLGWTPNTGCITAWITSFADYDKNKSGTISRKELRAMLRERGGSISPEQTKEIIDRADSNNSGTIEVPEFIGSMMGGTVTAAMVHELAELPPHLLRVTLRSIDSDGNGTLTAKEIGRFMRALGLSVNETALKQRYKFREFQGFLQTFSS